MQRFEENEIEAEVNDATMPEEVVRCDECGCTLEADEIEYQVCSPCYRELAGIPDDDEEEAAAEAIVDQIEAECEGLFDEDGAAERGARQGAENSNFEDYR